MKKWPENRCEGAKKMPKEPAILYDLLKKGRIACGKSRYVVSFKQEDVGRVLSGIMTDGGTEA